MDITINEKDITLNFGLDFIAYLDDKFSIAQNGIKLGLGVQQAYTQLMTGSPLIILDIIKAGQLNSKVKASEKEIKAFIENNDDLDGLFDDFLSAFETSSLTKKTANQMKESMNQAMTE